MFEEVELPNVSTATSRTEQTLEPPHMQGEVQTQLTSNDGDSDSDTSSNSDNSIMTEEQLHLLHFQYHNFLKFDYTIKNITAEPRDNSEIKNMLSWLETKWKHIEGIDLELSNIGHTVDLIYQHKYNNIEKKYDDMKRKPEYNIETAAHNEQTNNNIGHEVDLIYQPKYNNVEKKFDDLKRPLEYYIWTAYYEQPTPIDQLPYFDGHNNKWLTFRDLFLECVHNNPTLMKAEKMKLLKEKLLGTAKNLVKRLGISTGNYGPCWKILIDHYNSDRRMLTDCMTRLLNQSDTRPRSPNSIRKLHDAMMHCLNRLRHIGLDTTNFDPIVVYLCIKKLDSVTYDEYINQIKRPRELPDLEEFSEFLTSKVRSLEALKLQSSKKSLKLKRKKKKSNKKQHHEGSESRNNNCKRLLFTTCMDKLLNQPIIEPTSACSIRQLHDVMRECINEFQHVGLNTTNCEPIVVHLFIMKLDCDTYSEYLNWIEYSRQYPDVEKFAMFLQSKVRSLEARNLETHETNNETSTAAS